jgi:hypothetical protein
MALFAPLSGRDGPSRRSERWLDASVNHQEKKILPGQPVSGVSWRHHVDVPVHTGAVYDTA